VELVKKYRDFTNNDMTAAFQLADGQLVEKGYEELRGLCEVVVEQEMLKGVVQRYAPNVMMTKLEKINVGELHNSQHADDHPGVRQVLPLYRLALAAH
jgi:hypothetical protein